MQEEEPPVDTSRMTAGQTWRAPEELALGLTDDQPEPGNGADSKERGILVSTWSIHECHGLTREHWPHALDRGILIA